MTTLDAASEARALAPDRLRRRCDPASLPFETTAELVGEPGLIGQERAARALEFSLAMAQDGFNAFVAGTAGTGKTTTVRAILERAASRRPAPPDWCYVHNFDEPARPRALRLPPGQGRLLRNRVRALIEAARRDIPRAFESEEYIAQRERIINDLNRKREQGFAQLSTRAQLRGFAVQPTPMGIALAPVLGNRPLSNEEVAGLRPEMRETIQRNREQLETEVQSFLKEVRATEREARQQLEAQDRDVALHAVGGLVDDLIEDYAELPEVGAYLQAVREAILADVALFRIHPLPVDGSPRPETPPDPATTIPIERAFRKYEVNVVVDNGGRTGAPVVLESNPTYANLIGRIEREALLGALVTDVSLIAPGALHSVNGGYLMLRAEELLRSPASWDALKRALREGCVVIEDLSEVVGLATTRGLRPDPIPLEIKVCLLGNPEIYQLLYTADPEFRRLFKVRADFDTALDWTPEHELAYARFVGCWAAELGRPLDRAAVALIVEEAGRRAGSQRKLDAHFGLLRDLVSEANQAAALEQSGLVGADHVRRALEQRHYRAARVPEQIREMIARGVLLIDPRGSAVGQIHGLAVIGVGEIAFGQPIRITATVGVGREGLLDIERQAELGGRIHTKGVMILAGYLADRYAQRRPLVVAARLVFEQTYIEVEGDSASLAELLALLSRLADAPLRQGLAVTGSANQRGEVQAVGGVVEKVEGFYDTCVELGLTGEQGVVLPASNVDDLMLREDLVAAVAEGRFHIYAVSSVDQALEIMTGLPAGVADQTGNFPPETVHGRVEARLAALTQALAELSGPGSAHRDGARRARQAQQAD